MTQYLLSLLSNTLLLSIQGVLLAIVSYAVLDVINPLLGVTAEYPDDWKPIAIAVHIMGASIAGFILFLSGCPFLVVLLVLASTNGGAIVHLYNPGAMLKLFQRKP